MKQFHYRGDQTAPYDHDAGTGLVGKVFGPNRLGQFFVITSARYDEDEDCTYATAEALQNPNSLFEQMLAAES